LGALWDGKPSRVYGRSHVVADVNDFNSGLYLVRLGDKPREPMVP
jgi:hypothetical protein